MELYEKCGVFRNLIASTDREVWSLDDGIPQFLRLKISPQIWQDYTVCGILSFAPEDTSDVVAIVGNILLNYLLTFEFGTVDIARDIDHGNLTKFQIHETFVSYPHRLDYLYSNAATLLVPAPTF
eukprot:6181521-Pleurochrysis_carterae.AAC.2